MWLPAPACPWSFSSVKILTARCSCEDSESVGYPYPYPSSSLQTQSGGGNEDASSHHSWRCCHKALPSWLCYPACLDRNWLLLGSWQCWLLRQNGQVATMHDRAKKALEFQMGSLQISLYNCFMYFVFLENLFLSWECDCKILLASCTFKLTAGSVLHLEVFGVVCVHLCCTAHRSYNQSWGILSLKSPFASGVALDLKTALNQEKKLSQKYRMNNHFWVSRSAAAHRKKAHSLRLLFLHSLHLLFLWLPSHNRSSQVGQGTSHHRYPAETHQLHSCSTSCPSPSPDVQGTGHWSALPIGGFCYTSPQKPLNGRCFRKMNRNSKEYLFSW